MYIKYNLYIKLLYLKLKLVSLKNKNTYFTFNPSFKIIIYLLFLKWVKNNIFVRYKVCQTIFV